jgi:hypothetical protein
MGCNNDSENNTLQVFTIRKEPFEDLKQKDFGFENEASYTNIVRNSYSLDYKAIQTSYKEMWDLILENLGKSEVDPKFIS